MKWTSLDIPPQNGRLAVVTGVGGLGFEDALALARAGAEVVLAGRNVDKGTAAAGRIQAQVRSARVRFERLDLASLKSIADFADRLRRESSRLDLLVNNAGVMTPPKRLVTEDGFELQMGTNYLGHFALTARLMPLLRNGKDARVVTLSSVAARQGAIDFEDLNATSRYNPMSVYSQSKLACLMFALEMQRKSEAGGWGVSSLAAHPGVSRTDLLHNAPGRSSPAGIARSALWFLFQPVWKGALPTLFAATSPLAEAGAYYGPDGLGELGGYPTKAKTPTQALDADASAHLWRVSTELTGAAF